MSTHNIGFYEDLIKIIFQLSSNMHLISSVAQLSTSYEYSRLWRIDKNCPSIMTKYQTELSYCS